MGVNSLPKTVTGQRRSYDLNPSPSAPESSTLTTRLLSFPDVKIRCKSGAEGFLWQAVSVCEVLRYNNSRRSLPVTWAEGSHTQTLRTLTDQSLQSPSCKPHHSVNNNAAGAKLHSGCGQSNSVQCTRGVGRAILINKNCLCSYDMIRGAILTCAQKLT